MGLFDNFDFGPDGKLKGVKPKKDADDVEILKARPAPLAEPLSEGTVIIDTPYEPVPRKNK